MTKFFSIEPCLAILVFLNVIQCSEAQNDANQLKIWSNRMTETVAQIALDGETKKPEMDYYVALAARALGQNGLTKDALNLFDRIGLKKDSLERHVAIMMLAGGLSESDFVEEAILQSSKIENEDFRSMSYGSVATRQAQRGDFEDAITLVEKIPNQRFRDDAIGQISDAYVAVGRLDDAKKLLSSIAQPNTRAAFQAKHDKGRAVPSILDADYVEAKLKAAKDGVFGGASEPELEFLKHYYLAEVALESKDQQRFDEEAGKAEKLAVELTKNNGLMQLSLARLMFKAERLDAAKSLFVGLLNRCLKEKDGPPAVGFNEMLFGSGPKSDAWMVANCVPDRELKVLIEELSKGKNSLIVAAPIYGEVIHRSNPDWAEVLYRDASKKVQAEFAINCLLAFARKQ